MLQIICRVSKDASRSSQNVRAYYFTAESQKECDDWVKAIIAEIMVYMSLVCSQRASLNAWCASSSGLMFIP